jgi:hypothetical protein
MRAWRPAQLAFAALFSLLACKQQVPSDAQRQAQGAPRNQQSYTLQIKFHGLIAFVEDTGKVWALLPKASYDEAHIDQIKEPDLPPGMYDELHKEDPADQPAFLHDKVPAHFPHIRFRNAKIISGFSGNPCDGRPIPGTDLSFVTGLDGPATINLCQLARALRIVESRSELKDDLPTLSQLDVVDAVKLIQQKTLDPRLAARALIGAGMVVANPVYGLCPNHPQTFYGFSLTTEDGCPGDAIKLAEEVIVTQQLSSSQVVQIDLGNGEKAISLGPDGSGNPVIIEVLNQTEEQLQDCMNPNCDEDTSHAEAYRWFYRLTSAAGQAKIDKHYFPCVQDADFGPPICPGKQLALPAKK